MTTLWVLDEHGYDARGGQARVFSTVDKAKQAAPWVTDWASFGADWLGDARYITGTSDVTVIYPVVLDSADHP